LKLRKKNEDTKKKHVDGKDEPPQEVSAGKRGSTGVEGLSNKEKTK